MILNGSFGSVPRRPNLSTQVGAGDSAVCADDLEPCGAPVFLHVHSHGGEAHALVVLPFGIRQSALDSLHSARGI